MKEYKIPLELVDYEEQTLKVDENDIEKDKQRILDFLQEEGVVATVTETSVGPRIVTYTLALQNPVKPRTLSIWTDTLCLYLEKQTYCTFNEEGMVEVGVEKRTREYVPLGQMLAEGCIPTDETNSLIVAMGKDCKNENCTLDLCKMIHTLVAGVSGSGKSMWINSMLLSLICHHSPKDMRLVLIDPKRVEFAQYNGLPHLLTGGTFTDPGESISVLQWLREEMERRYNLFRAKKYVADIDQYNTLVGEEEQLPKIVVVIDELADLMLADQGETETAIATLVQKSRAAGIHLIVATQRVCPSVLRGAIRSNIPTRLAFRVAADVDSRVILGQTGAQRLLGRGDYYCDYHGRLMRLQAPYVSYQTIEKVVEYVKTQYEAPALDEEVTLFIKAQREAKKKASSGEVNAKYIEVLRWVAETGMASISAVQRKFSVGYNKAGEMIEWMEDKGYISTFDGTKKRDVLITLEEVEKLYGKADDKAKTLDEPQEESKAHGKHRGYPLF